jgi:hypothetical protein
LPQDGIAGRIVDNQVTVSLEVEEIARVTRGSCRVPSTVALRYVINEQVAINRRHIQKVLSLG